MSKKKRRIGCLIPIILVVVLLFVGIFSPPAEQAPDDSSGISLIASSKADTAVSDLAESKNQSSEKVSSKTEAISSKAQSSVGTGKTTAVSLADIPAYSNKPYIAVNGNIPNFSANELVTKGYESYSSLDSLGRTKTAVACVGKDTMPKEDEKRGSISKIKPSGWVQSSYDFINGKYLYNRCHLIGWQLSAENANKCNLMTGTKYFNTKGMLPFENMVADYINETENHVAYRITPIYYGNNLLASGVQMEAYSVEDNGEGICFNVFVYNVQPQITIDYATGKSTGPANTQSSSSKKASSSSKAAVSAVASKAEVSSSSKIAVSSSSKPVSSAAPAVSSQQEVTTSPQTEQMVWVTATGKKYHCVEKCRNTKSSRQIPLSEAKELGLTACKNCYK